MGICILLYFCHHHACSHTFSTTDTTLIPNIGALNVVLEAPSSVEEVAGVLEVCVTVSVCIPIEGEVTLLLFTGADADSAQGRLIEIIEMRIPYLP